jgi:hypothetical protein
MRMDLHRDTRNTCGHIFSCPFFFLFYHGVSFFFLYQSAFAIVKFPLLLNLLLFLPPSPGV